LISWPPLAGALAPDATTKAEVYVRVDSLVDVGQKLAEGKPESLERLYRDLRLELVYQPRERAVDARLAPGVVSVVMRWR